MMIHNFLQKLRAKQEEKKDIENFLCMLEGKSLKSNCQKLDGKKYLRILMGFLKDLKQNRIFKIDNNYSWKDWIENQEGVETYKVRLKTLKNGNHNNNHTGGDPPVGGDFGSL